MIFLPYHNGFYAFKWPLDKDVSESSQPAISAERLQDVHNKVDIFEITVHVSFIIRFEVYF